MSDNPFAAPGDADRTVIRPMPGGARIAPRAAPSAAGPDLESIASRGGALATAAAPLLHLLARVRNTVTAPDPGDMRERTWRELKAFERRARNLGVPPDQLRLAHFALCAALDDVVLNTPWGSQGRWREQPLAIALHGDDKAGESFFEQIRAVRAALPASLPVLELMFVCLSLGMMGPYRTSQDGPAKLDRVRHHVFELITKTAPPALPALAPDAAGIETRAAARRNTVPVWVAGSAALAIVGGVYWWGLTSLNAASDGVLRTALAAPPASMPALVRPPATPPPPPPPPTPGLDERIRAALADLRDVDIVATPAEVIVRAPARTLFAQPNATLTGTPTLDRIADAMRGPAGPIVVLVYADRQPTHSVAFPSNYALTSARARTIGAALGKRLGDPALVKAEGRADADPLTSDTSADGRERNRRVEFVLQRQP
jgi:type VI secretion system protein ImpK